MGQSLLLEELWGSSQQFICISASFIANFMSLLFSMFIFSFKIPAGSRHIDVSMTWYLNRNVRLELWDARDEKIIGSGGRHGSSRYKGVAFADTTWAYSQSSFLRAEGPTDQDLVIKALRQDKPITKIHASYLRSDKA